MAAIDSGILSHLFVCPVWKDPKNSMSAFYISSLPSQWAINLAGSYSVPGNTITPVPPALLCKAKRQYLLTLQVSRYCLLAFQYIVTLNLLCNTGPRGGIGIGGRGSVPYWFSYIIDSYFRMLPFRCVSQPKVHRHLLHRWTNYPTYMNIGTLMTWWWFNVGPASQTVDQHWYPFACINFWCCAIQRFTAIYS